MTATAPDLPPPPIVSFHTGYPRLLQILSSLQHWAEQDCWISGQPVFHLRWWPYSGFPGFGPMFVSLLHWICLCNKWSSRFSPPDSFRFADLHNGVQLLSLTQPRILLRFHRVSLDFKVYEGRWGLHPPPTDSASSVKPADHKNAGTKENGSRWECLFLNCCRPQTVSVHLCSGTLGLSEVQ